MRKLCASIALLLPFFLTGSVVFADVWVKYSYNEWREGRIVKEDQWGTLVELKNALTNQYDPPGEGFQMYVSKDRISATKPANADHPGNAPGGMTAQVPNAAFNPGQIVQFNDKGKMADGIVVRQDAHGVLVKYRNWATGKFDGDFQAYHAVADLQPGNPAPADLPGAAANPANPANAGDPAQLANQAQAANPAIAAKPFQAAPVVFPKGIPIEFINNDPNWQEHINDPNWRAWVKDQMDRGIPNPAQAFVDPVQAANPAQVNPVQAVNPAQVDPAQNPANPGMDPAQNPANPARDPWLPAQPAGPDGVPPLQLPNNPIGLGGPVMTDRDVIAFLNERLGPEPFSPDNIRRNIRDGVMKDLQAEILSRGVTPAANYSAIENKEFVKELRFYGTPDFVHASLTQGQGEPIKNKEWYYGTWNSTHVAARNKGIIEKGNAGGLTINEDGTYKWLNGATTYEGEWRLATKPEMDVSYKGGTGIVLEGARGGRPFIVTEDDEHGNTVAEGIRIQDLQTRSDQTRAGR